MQQALTDAERMIAVLSPRYFQSSFTEAEWTTAFYQDVSGEEGRLLPIRIEEFSPPGMFGPRNYLDVFDLDAGAARQRLLDWVGRAGKQRLNPTASPPFLGLPRPQDLNPISPAGFSPYSGCRHETITSPAAPLCWTNYAAILRPAGRPS